MKNTAKFLRFTFALLFLAAVGVGFWQRQAILDNIALQNYTPPARIVELADQVAMQDSTRRVFYINQPQINNKTDFRQNCKATEQSIVLGCYVERQGIYLLDVQEPQLNGVMQVTAAHEVLHAEYDRLSKKDREDIDTLTANFFAGLNDERIKNTVQQYKEKDASVVPNELHSILATEVRQLSPELEEHYSKYFKDRSQIVAFSEKYEQTFVELNSQVESYDDRLKVLKSDIESSQVEIEGLSSELEQQKSRLDDLLNSDMVQDYNQSVPVYNSRVADYNSLINQTKAKIAEYNSIVEKRNAIVTAEQELIEAINSNIETKRTE